jgi:hypothetical protein
MGVSRRSLITSAVAGSAFAAIAGSELVQAAAAYGASPAGDVVGKITVGYQGWFACIGDGAPINGWWHWAQNWGQSPSPSNNGTLRVREPGQRPAGDPVLVVRPADGQRALPVDAGQQH